jgi:class 3 adenylate cyclase/DNA-binding winged helix-turn-helix (wHTH) protein/tetratricopeptide (TPR) repeat protein
LLYSFDEYTLDTDRRELRRGDSLICVEPQVFDLLEYLIRNRKRVVSKDDLITTIWGGRIVSESALSTRTNAARCAIGDSGKEQRLIRTHRRKGIRFVGSVHEANEPEATAAAVSAEVTEPSGTSHQPVTPISAPGARDRTEDHFREMPHTEAERRQLTVMSCELVEAAASITRMNLEDLRDAIDTFHRCIAGTAGRLKGFTAKRMGNTALVYFGYPVAHEDDAEQAVRAGLELCAAVKSRVFGTPDLQCRIGIATGMVLVGDPVGVGNTVGDALDLAARLQALARPDTVVIDRTTKRLIGGLFDCCDFGVFEVTGGAELVQAWRVVGPGMVEGRFAALHPEAPTPLVGRQEEVELLLRRWEQVKCGEERVVLISGEAGIGKSRLIAALEERVQFEPLIRLHLSGAPNHTDSALYPFITQLERSAHFERKDTTEEKFSKLDVLIASAVAPSEDTALLADLLSLPATDRRPHLNLSPQRKRERTSEALIRQFAGLARRMPVLMIFEDVHWIDPTSLDILSLIIDHLRSLPVLLLVTFRPEFQAPWLGQSNVTTLSLNRLGPREGARLAQQVAGNKTLPSQILDEIVERTDGVPLFVEELTKAVLEAGEAEGGEATSLLRLSALAVPATLQASLMARLDRLGPAKQIAQIGAAIGREFPYEVLAMVAHQPEDKLQSSLDRLFEAGLVFRRGAPPQATFIFKHALVQDTAYGTLLRRPRRELHARIAEVLERQFPETVEQRPEVLAHHFAEAGQADRAVQYWIRAGDLATLRSTSREAATHYRSALRIVDEQPQTAPMRQIEAELCMKLGNAIMQFEGYGSVGAIEAYRRGSNRAAALDQPEGYAKAAIGLAPLLFSDCRYKEVLETLQGISGNLLGRLRPQTRVHLFTMLGVANYCLGNFLVAWEEFDAAREIDLDSPCTHENPVGGGDPAIVLRNYMGMCGAVLGRLEDSVALTQEGLTLARARSDAFTLAWALLGRVRLHRALGRFAEGIPIADEAVDICERHGFRARLGSVLIVRGALQFGLGDVERGLAEMRRGIDIWRETSGRFHMSEWLSYMVDRLIRADCRDEADVFLREGERIVDATNERSHVAEIRRLRGNLLYRDGAVDAAVICLEQAIGWAHQQHAKVLELRARRDLARLQIGEGRPKVARVILNRALSQFPKELVFPDLDEARELLPA